MKKRFLLIFIILCPHAALACIMASTEITHEHLMHPPKGMVAFEGEILKVTVPEYALHNDVISARNTIPHAGFTIHFKVKKVFAGKVKPAVDVEYGVCNSIPGKIGQVIPVLAVSRDGKLQAPQWVENNSN